MLRSIALLILALPVVQPSSTIHGGPAPGTAVSTTARRVKLTLFLPRRTYPRGSLVRVRVSLQNVSRKPVMVGATSAPECVHRGPAVQVLDAGGTVVYPPAVPWVMASCGPPILPVALPPGHAMHHATLTILRGPVLRGVASIGPMGSPQEITTPPLYVTLTNEPPPGLALDTTPQLHLVVTPSRAISSQTFFFMQGSICPASPPAVQTRSATPRWQPTGLSPSHRFRLLAYCAAPVRWVFVGGWLNHPVVSLDYPSR